MRIILGDNGMQFFDSYILTPRAASKLAIGDWIERIYIHDVISGASKSTDAAQLSV